MNRRTFFTRLWKFSLMGLAAMAFSNRKPAPAYARVQVGETLYQGTPDGRVLASTDAGATWQQIVSFGSDYSVLKLIHTDRFYAQLRFRGAHFGLKSADGRRWYTESWEPPASAARAS